MHEKQVRTDVAQQSIASVFGRTARVAAELAVAILLVRFLSQQEYGVLRFALLISNTLQAIGSLGVPQAILFFFPVAGVGEQEALSRHFLRIILALGSVVAATIFAIGQFGTWPSEMGTAIRVCALLPVCQTLCAGLTFRAIAQGRAGRAGVMSTYFASCHLLGFSLPAFMGHGVVGILLGGTIGWIAASLVALSTLRGRSGSPSKVSSGTILKYALPLSLTASVAAINGRIDKYLISAFFSPTTYALFAVGATEIPFAPILAYAVGNVLIPKIRQTRAEGDGVLRLWHDTIQWVSLIVAPVFWLLLVLADVVIRTIFTDAYSPAVSVFRLYLFLLPLRVTSYGAILQAIGDTKSILSGAVSGLTLNLGLGLLLVKTVGWTGPAIATIIAQVFMVVFMVGRIARRLNVPISSVFPVSKWCTIFSVAGVSVVPLAASLVWSASSAIVFLAGIAFIPLYLAGLHIFGVWRLIARSNA